MRSNFNLIFLALLLWLISASPARADWPLNPVAGEELTPYQKVTRFHQGFPQQKVYLDTDKKEYLAGEVLWLKAYLVSARNHVPDTTSTNLFVEFISNRNEVVDFMVLKLDKGFGQGHIQLPDSIRGGSYQLKAYTNWMNNFDEDFIFLREIFVHNPDEPNYISRSEIRQNNRFNEDLEEKRDQRQFAFFPEGGHLVAGLENRVAFKATDDLGAGLDAKGVLLDGQGKEVLEFVTVHDGMGVFSFSPQAGVQYSAQVEFSGGKTLSVPVPAALSQGYLLRVDPERDNIHVRVSANFDPASLGLSPEILLVAHTRGQVCFVEQGVLVNGSFQTRAPLDRFPEGIAHFTLFDSNDTPLAERLAFVYQDPSAEDALQVSYQLSASDSLVVADLLFEPGPGISPSEASYSLSVVEKFGPFNADGQNIATYFLLSSDFGSTISNPWYYFAGGTPERRQHLDLLMMTHGWRRFVWKDLLAGKGPEILHQESTGLTLAGQVKPVSSSRETGELNVEISIGENQDRKILKTRTDSQGFFAFTGLDFEGSFTALLSVERDRTGRTFKVELAGSTHQTTAFVPGPATRPQQTTERGPDWKRRDRPGFFSRLVNRPSTGQESEVPSMFGIPDQVIYMEDLKVNYTNVYDILRDRVTGLTIINGQIALRGPSSIMLSSEPIFFVDAVQVSPNYFFQISVNEIERIEVLRGAGTAILGSRGANGAIFIYTQRAEHRNQFSYEYQLMGFHVDRDFFPSMISTQKYLDQEVPRTILWVPSLVPDDSGHVRVRIPYHDDHEKLHFRLEGVDRLGQIMFLQF